LRITVLSHLLNIYKQLEPHQHQAGAQRQVGKMMRKRAETSLEEGAGYHTQGKLGTAGQ